MTRYINNPCALLSKSTVASLGLSGGGNSVAGAGVDSKQKACSWGKSPFTVQASIDTVGLAGQNVKQQSVHFYPIFKMTTVDGFPAAYLSLNGDKSKGQLSIDIAANDKQAVSLDVNSVSSPSKTKPTLDKAAKAVVATIKGAK